MTRIPPLVLVAVCAGLMIVTDRLLPVALDFPGRVPLAAMVALLGLAVAFSAVLVFRRSGTTVDPRTPAKASALITGGPFRFSRNPMYVAFAAWLLAFAFWLGNAFAFLFVALFVLWMDRLQIPAEEAALRSNFGPAFDEYARRTRRWL